MNNYTLYCLGSRGSWPVEGHAFNLYGGNTSCYVLKKNNYAMVIDCGTGLFSARNLFIGCNKIDIILTHVHYDHVLGLLDWSVFPDQTVVNVYGNFKKWFGEVSFDEFFKEPFCENKPDFAVHTYPDSDTIFNNDLTLSFEGFNKKEGPKVLTIKNNDENIVFVTNCENIKDIKLNKNKHTSYLVFDGMLDDRKENYKKKNHASFQDGAKLAAQTKPERLIITHHSPLSEDTELDDCEAITREIFPNTDFAKAGQSWSFPLENINNLNKDEDYVDFRIKDYISNKLYSFKETIKRANNRSYYTILYANLFFSIFALTFTIIDLLIISNIPYEIFFTMAILLGANYFVLKGNPKLYRPIKHLFGTEMFIMIMLLFISSEEIAYGYTWVLTIPTSSMFVLGRKGGTIMSAAAEIAMLIMLNTNKGKLLFKAPLPVNAGVKLPILFVNFVIICFVIETVRASFSKELKKITESQEEVIQKQTKELRNQNYSLIANKTQLEMRNRLLNETFGKFLPDQLISEQLASNNIGLRNTKTKATIMRIGIRGFKHLASSMEANDTVTMLNNYFNEASIIIKANDGVVLEYVGDSILAVFGAPLKDDLQADHAVKSAIELQNKMFEINQFNNDNGFPSFKVGIGIHSGDVVLGAIGSENHLKYSAVGSGLELASSLESRSKGQDILISSSVYDLLSSTVHVINNCDVLIDSISKEITVLNVDGIGNPYNISINKVDTNA